jgi:hypothetical protein
MKGSCCGYTDMLNMREDWSTPLPPHKLSFVDFPATKQTLWCEWLVEVFWQAKHEMFQEKVRCIYIFYTVSLTQFYT